MNEETLPSSAPQRTRMTRADIQLSPDGRMATVIFPSDMTDEELLLFLSQSAANLRVARRQVISHQPSLFIPGRS